ncbi:MAG: hypothetical protein H7221_07055, partial [Flavobacterium sp.]|nr:hypothetical protein [Flavobacterium sp.]
MYTFSSKLKTLSFVLMILGIVGIGVGFYTAPKTIQDVEKILASSEHQEGGHEAAESDATAHDAASVTEHHIADVNHNETTAAENNVSSTAVVNDSVIKTDSLAVVAPVKPIDKPLSENEIAALK